MKFIIMLLVSFCLHQEIKTTENFFKCNGKADLCERPYNKIAQINVHNATSTTKHGLILPVKPCWQGFRLGICGYDTGINPVADQLWDLDEQLAKGLRVFKIPIHPVGKSNTPWATHTVSTGEFDNVVDSIVKKVPLGKDLLKKAVNAAIRNDLWRVDTSNLPFVNVLKKIKEFLDHNLHEVITLELNTFGMDRMRENFINDFKISGINKYIFKSENWPQWPAWPTLREMIENNQRLVLLCDSAVDEPGFLHSEEYKKRNNYNYNTFEELKADDCQQAKTTDPYLLFGMTHCITGAIAGSPVFADQANKYEVLKNHVTTCYKNINRYPNFISIDFVDKNFDDIKRVVDEINAQTWD